MGAIVATALGKIEGGFKRGAHTFRGIPFAAAPVGELRFRAPQRAAAWDGVRDATAYGPICPQVQGGLEMLAGAQQTNPTDEDCLTLNVWTPDPSAAGLPVMVWIHGGGFSTGSGRVPWYDGTNFARDGVVCVTINYRVNAFGFLHLQELFGDDFAGSGNAGILDQIAALEWVQENIESFGGDPRNVTIFGESAGGGSVGTLLGIASSRGLFGKAIPQSGAAHWAHEPQIATRVARALLEKVGVEPGDVEALRSVPSDRFVDAIQAFGVEAAEGSVLGDDFAGATMAFQPVADGAVLERPSIELLKAGAAKGVPVLVGTTKNEWNLFTLMSPGGGRVRAPRPIRNLCERAGHDVDALVAAYDDGSSELDLRNALETDHYFRIPAIRLAEAQAAAEAPVWMYRFDWPTPAFGGKLGACHAIEIPFVFDNLDAPGADAFTGNAAPRELATRMHADWVAFAKTGELGWPGYDAQRRATRIYDVEDRVEDDPGADRRKAWDGIL